LPQSIGHVFAMAEDSFQREISTKMASAASASSWVWQKGFPDDGGEKSLIPKIIKQISLSSHKYTFYIF